MPRHLITYIRIDELVEPSAPDLRSLALTDLEIRPDLDEKLVDVLDRGDDEDLLESLIVRSCSVHDYQARWRFEKLVGKITWECVSLISKGDIWDDEETEDPHTCGM